MAEDKEAATLPLPPARCLNKRQAAEYLGTGVTLLTQIGPRPIQLGRRRVYDVIDLNTWLDERYEEILGFVRPGRAVYAGLRGSLDF